MTLELPTLPYSKDALTPHMSVETLELHHGKHHAGYVKKLNAGLEGSPLAGKSLEEIIQSASGGLFNNAAQHWNHSFFWKCLKPQGGGQPSGELADAINRDFGSYEKFRDSFAAAAASQFGSGWAWLVSEGNTLKITTTSNADLPLAHGQTALFTIDVWEHAYYVDYRNERPRFIATVLDELANWDFAQENLKKG